MSKTPEETFVEIGKRLREIVVRMKAGLGISEEVVPLTVYEARQEGRKYCETEGSDHYIQPGVEPMDLIISSGYAHGFCLGSIIKYAVRYGETENPEDLKKIADYAHILCGVEIADEEVRCDETTVSDDSLRHSGGG